MLWVIGVDDCVILCVNIIRMNIFIQDVYVKFVKMYRMRDGGFVDDVYMDIFSFFCVFYILDGIKGQIVEVVEQQGRIVEVVLEGCVV